MDSQIEIEEKIKIVDHFTQQLINSGYKGPQIRDIIVSSIKGIMRKERRREKEGKKKYRSAEETLIERMKKKLLEATSWHKETKSNDEDDCGRNDNHDGNDDNIDETIDKSYQKTYKYYDIWVKVD